MRRRREIEPGGLKGARRAAEWALAVATAQELGLLEALAEEPRTLSHLTSSLNLDPRGAAMLLGVLREAGLVEGEGEGEAEEYRLTGQGRARFVDRDAPDFEADAMRQWLVNIRRWAGELAEAVRTGRPPAGSGRAGETWEEDEEEALARFMAAMANKDPRLVEAVVAACATRLREGGVEPARSRVLDLGGGPGVFARRFAAWGAEVVLADRPEVVEHVAERYGLSSVPGLELWRGDFLERLPDGPFDLILLANITHIYDPDTNRRLLIRLGERLRSGGVLAILDFVRGAAPFASLFALTMLLHTERGNTYTRGDYEAWLEEAGLRSVRLLRLDDERHLVSARRVADEGASRSGAGDASRST